ncbi:FAD/NAD(P)-binding domain-containing protein [Pleurostoma richardsiae]|uniref:FAD/NAD(P)-binding domain-containing protein n=1 Tax=Pleurostoma richardsiae TaxID=41990 RepID=A0AA38RTX5_9PEZI|nr:FAD/NAD(P)-binding domain-containing protein [Pleurostoma richardsiae]
MAAAAPAPPGQERQHTIAILGAGIGGLALAIGLIKRGVPCTIYESAKEFSVVGAGIGFGPNTLNAIDLIDPRFRTKYDDAKTANERAEFEHCVFDALYAEEGFGEKRGWTRGIVGASYFTRSSAHRKDLLEIMESFIPPGTVKFSKRAEEIRQVDDKVVVRFQDGDTVMVDALIGCDGVKGITRAATLGSIAPGSVAPEYANMYIYRGILPMSDAKDILGRHGGDAKWFMAKGKGVAIYPISKGAEENFVFFVHDPNPWRHQANTVECTREEMAADLDGFDPRLIKLLDWAKPLRWAVYHHRHTPTYYNGRVCMLGDVAHASTPHQAAGAGQGLEDAVVLAHLLSLTRSADQLGTAFQVYDQVRRPRATKVVETSYEAGLMYLWLGTQGEDMHEIVENANGRLHWIWQHDLQADLDTAEAEYLSLMQQRQKQKEDEEHEKSHPGQIGLHATTRELPL